MKKRLFIAIEIPEELRSEIRKSDFSAKGFKATNPDQLHLTLRFIGDFPEKQIPDLISKLIKISFTESSLCSSEAGFFPNGKRPSVFFLGFSVPTKILKLKSDIDEALESFGFDKETRNFVPHLTLGRFKRKPEKETIQNFEIRSAEFADFSFSVKEFILFSSEITEEGAIHSVEARFSL